MPLGLIYSGRAVGRAGDRGFAWAGLVLSIIALTLVGVAIVISLISN